MVGLATPELAASIDTHSPVLLRPRWVQRPAAQLVGLFDALLDALDRHGFFGCPFVSAAVEAPLDSEARAITVRHTERRHAWLTELATEAGAGDRVALAPQIGLLIDGALTSGRLLQDRAVVDEAKGGARSLVAQHAAWP